MKESTIMFLYLFFILFFITQSISQQGVSGIEQTDWTPWEYTNTSQFNIPLVKTTTSTNPLSLSLMLWKELSKQDGPTCPFIPSCAGYTVTAIHKHGPITGWIMGIDRFSRDHRWARDDNYPIINWHLYDPVE